MSDHDRGNGPDEIVDPQDLLSQGDRGLGSEGTIPDEPGSVGVGAGEPTTFEPEEDVEAAADRDPDVPT